MSLFHRDFKLVDWAPLDARVGRFSSAPFVYLMGNPGTARALLAAYFLLAERSTGPVLWINITGTMPRLATRVAEAWNTAVHAGRIQVTSIENPGIEAESLLGKIEEKLNAVKPARVVFHHADLLTGHDNAAAWSRLVHMCRSRNIPTLALGTMSHLGGDIDLSPAPLTALADVLLVTRLFLGGAGRLMSVTVIKPVQATGRADQPIYYKIAPEGLELDHQPATEMGINSGGTPPPDHLPSVKPRNGSSRRFTFVPELMYFSAEHEGYIRNRVETMNSRKHGMQVHLPENPFSSPVEYNRHFEQFKQGQRRWDLFIADVYRLRELVENDMIWPLDEFMPPEWREQFLPVALEQCTFEGQLFAVPHWINVGVMLYRPDLLAKYKLEPPRTWDEVVERSNIITRGEGRDNFCGFLYPGAPSEALTISFLEFLWNNGGDVYDQPLHISINSNEGKEALTFMRDLIHKHRVASPSTPDLSETETARQFHAGNAAFLRGWPQVLNMQPRRRGINPSQMDLTSLPTRYGSGPGQSVIGGFCFVVPRYVENPEPLMDFCRKFYSQEAIPELAIRGWTCPPYLAAYENRDVLRHRPFYSQIMELMKNGRARKNIPHYETLSTLVQTEISDALRGLKSPEQVLDNVASSLHSSVYKQVRELRLQRVTDYINENLHEDLSRDRMAALCHLSPSYFSTLFAETMNRPFARYVNEKRIERARHLLETTELTIAEIAERVGFRDQGYFCNVFREETRMPPSRYRLDALAKVTHR